MVMHNVTTGLGEVEKVALWSSLATQSCFIIGLLGSQKDCVSEKESGETITEDN